MHLLMIISKINKFEYNKREFVGATEQVSSS